MLTKRFLSTERASGKEDQEADPEAIYRIRCKNAEGALKSTNASIKAIEGDEAFGRFTAAEGVVARYRPWTSAIVLSRTGRRRQVELPKQQIRYPAAPNSELRSGNDLPSAIQAVGIPDELVWSLVRW